MIAAGTCEVGGVAVTVRELTVGEIRAKLAAGAASIPTDALHVLMFDEFSVGDLLEFSDLTAAQVESLKPSELREVWRRVQEVNADFFALRARLLALAPALESTSQAGPTPPEASSEPLLP